MGGFPLIPRGGIMSKKGKSYNEKLELVDKTKNYELGEAVDLVQKTARAKFDETVELHVRLGVDSKKADQQVRGAVVLPHGTGRDVKVLVFAQGEKVAEAEAAGADFVGGEDLADKIVNENWFDFDVAIATPDMMGVVGKIGSVLGPKGLMPNPKSGTVTFDVKDAVADTKAGKVEYRLDKSNIIHVPVGKVSFGSDKLTDNLKTILAAIIKDKPSAAKGKYLKSVTLAATMGPGIKVSTDKLMDASREAQKAEA